MPISPEAALLNLREGNDRFVRNEMLHPRQDRAYREQLLREGQHPFATVLTCSDSRVMPGFLFDQGLGDLFLIRNAGNVVGEVVLGSIEFAVEKLKTPLLVILGHTNCGAVTATVNGGKVEGFLNDVILKVQPAVDRARLDNPLLNDNDLLIRAIEENVHQGVQDMYTHSAIVHRLVRQGQLKVLGAIYDLVEGSVAWIDAPLEWAELLRV